jgi:hypothetical protein
VERPGEIAAERTPLAVRRGGLQGGEIVGVRHGEMAMKSYGGNRALNGKKSNALGKGPHSSKRKKP